MLIHSHRTKHGTRVAVEWRFCRQMVDGKKRVVRPMYLKSEEVTCRREGRKEKSHDSRRMSFPVSIDRYNQLWMTGVLLITRRVVLLFWPGRGTIAFSESYIKYLHDTPSADTGGFDVYRPWWSRRATLKLSGFNKELKNSQIKEALHGCMVACNS